MDNQLPKTNNAVINNPQIKPTELPGFGFILKESIEFYKRFWKQLILLQLIVSGVYL